MYIEIYDLPVRSKCLATEWVRLSNLWIDAEKKHAGVGSLAEGIGVKVHNVRDTCEVCKPTGLHKIPRRGRAGSVDPIPEMS